ncbi:hypothetical protein [Paenibacillus cremeus]|uniref:MerR family transcriptional regulator n=1 Tax=Paenibacillus cremeus TaxID=2163881 RepID=A0A559K596_9BACL|nr:hypothetical protein [Paenibacillus cremeus]TVY07312.1 hypothetical protein FPZ49_24525 [Paenibacillus cremeus]
MQLEKAWKITEFAKLIDKHYNTVDQWFKQLEDKQVHYVNRVAGEKVYDETDLDIGRYIKEARDKNYNLQIIFDQLKDVFDLRPFPEDWITGDALVDIEGIKRSMEIRFESMLQEAKRDILVAAAQAAASDLEQNVTKYLPAPKSHEEITFERSNEMLTKIRIDNLLEERAVAAWNALPESEKMKKVGLFRKDLDWEKRDAFIRKFKNENYEQLVKEQYGITDGHPK